MIYAFWVKEFVFAVMMFNIGALGAVSDKPVAAIGVIIMLWIIFVTYEFEVLQAREGKSL